MTRRMHPIYPAQQCWGLKQHHQQQLLLLQKTSPQRPHSKLLQLLQQIRAEIWVECQQSHNHRHHLLIWSRMRVQLIRRPCQTCHSIPADLDSTGPSSGHLQGRLLQQHTSSPAGDAAARAPAQSIGNDTAPQCAQITLHAPLPMPQPAQSNPSLGERQYQAEAEPAEPASFVHLGQSSRPLASSVKFAFPIGMSQQSSESRDDAASPEQYGALRNQVHADWAMIDTLYGAADKFCLTSQPISHISMWLVRYLVGLIHQPNVIKDDLSQDEAC